MCGFLMLLIVFHRFLFWVLFSFYGWLCFSFFIVLHPESFWKWSFDVVLFDKPILVINCELKSDLVLLVVIQSSFLSWYFLTNSFVSIKVCAKTLCYYGRYLFKKSHLPGLHYKYHTQFVIIINYC